MAKNKLIDSKAIASIQKDKPVMTALAGYIGTSVGYTGARVLMINELPLMIIGGVAGVLLNHFYNK